MTRIWTAEEFEPLAGTAFLVPFDNGIEVEITLTEVRRLGPQEGPWREPFALQFRAPGPWAIRQGTYRLFHPTLGEIELFLTAGTPDARGACEYSAVFS